MFDSENHDEKFNDELQLMQLKLKEATRMKGSAEIEMYKLNNAEKSLCEEMLVTKSEIEMTTRELEDLKDKLTEASLRVINAEMHREAEKSRMECYVSYINDFRNGFTVMFEKKRKASELRQKELREREAEKQELEKQRLEEIGRRKEQQSSEAKAVEEECEAIERECSVLKKRNAAIMLKLRKKLLETEDARRELITRMEDSAEAKQ